MKALTQNLIVTSLSPAGLPGTQHCTSLGPGQRPVIKDPEQPVAVLRHIPGVPLVLVQEALMQHLTFAGSLGQRSVTVKPVIISQNQVAYQDEARGNTAIKTYRKCIG